jgi:polysaccharide export outer membrane protein
MTPVFSPLRWACALFFLGVLTVQSSIAQPVDTRLTVPALGAAGAGKVASAAATPPAPDTNAPPAAQPPAPGSVPVDYKIGPNDLLDIEVFGVSELKRQVRVNSTGHVSMPLIGLVPMAGLSPADAEAMLALAYSEKYLQDPQVSIFVREFTTQRITLDGALVKPGIYPLIGQITLLRALAMAGGGSQMANLEQVMLFRVTSEGQRLTETHDVMKIRNGEAPDPLLQSEDMVVVNRDTRRTALRDSLFRDIIDTINPFSSSYRNVTTP